MNRPLAAADNLARVPAAATRVRTTDGASCSWHRLHAMIAICNTAGHSRQPHREKNGWSRAAIQVAFTIFVLTETWLVPIEATWSTSSARGRSCSSAASCAAWAG